MHLGAAKLLINIFSHKHLLINCISYFLLSIDWGLCGVSAKLPSVGWHRLYIVFICIYGGLRLYLVIAVATIKNQLIAMCTSFILDLQWFINSNGDDSSDQQSQPAGQQQQQQCCGAYLIQLTRYVYKINLGQSEREKERERETRSCWACAAQINNQLKLTTKQQWATRGKCRALWSAFRAIIA